MCAAVGFNSILELPLYIFEGDNGFPTPRRTHQVPNDIFGLPLRPDILHRCYMFYRRAKAGYSEDMQLYKWEWPGSTRKWRKQQKTGKARIGWKKSPGKYLGVFAHPIRPGDQRTKLPRRVLWTGLKIMLSAKFAQSQINLVDSFLMKSHKTKYAVCNLRRILGNNCNSALLVFCGNSDSNENFRWATANIPAVRLETVEGLNVYNLLKYRQLVITEMALKKLIHLIHEYPRKMNWLPRFATPNNTPAPIPQKVDGWNQAWIDNKIAKNMASRTREQWLEDVKKWKWSTSIKGAIKVHRNDPLEAFRLIHISHNVNQEAKIRYRYLYDSVSDPMESLDIEDANDGLNDDAQQHTVTWPENDILQT
eukprot:XP_001610806.1 50S ribosomal protein L4 [Babesia bovis T2Bo]